MDLSSQRLQPVEFLVDQELAFKDPATLLPYKVGDSLVYELFVNIIVLLTFLRFILVRVSKQDQVIDFPGVKVQN